MEINCFKAQSGRSMVEMLGVLAIVGVLSVGALAGYSSAMITYKANESIQEIRELIINIKSLYEDQSNYAGITSNVLIDAGFLDDSSNILGEYFSLDVASDSDTLMRLAYILPDNSDYICQKILLAGWEHELGADLDRISIWNGSITVAYRYEEGSYQFPITLDGAVEVCASAIQIAFITH
ncbi:MAG: hypothetical protein GY804_06010 [Alphaproteobacteria bacterium]|nr:hypothetical protein [Alphaproteobacteria bacterium]